MRIQNHYLVIIILFITIISLPLSQTIIPVIPVAPAAENRVKASLPEFNGTAIADGSYMSKFNMYFNDHYGMRDLLIHLHNWIDYFIFQVSGNPEVIIGRDEFLFISDSLADYNKTATLSEKEADKIAYNFKNLQNILARYRIQFLFFVGPNPSTIYGEKMPFPRKNPDGISNYDRIKISLDKHGVNHLDLIPVLMEEKKKYLLYYRRDTHWNRYAGVTVANQILMKLDPAGAKSRRINITGSKPEIRDSDMNILLGIDPRETADEPVIEKKKIVNKLTSALWLHDSYSVLIFPYIEPYFANISCFNYYEVPYNYFNFEQNRNGIKYFVFEIAERGLPNLRNWDFEIINHFQNNNYNTLRLDINDCSHIQQLDITHHPRYKIVVSSGHDPQLVWKLAKQIKPKYLYINFTPPEIKSPLQIFWMNENDKNFIEDKSKIIIINPIGSEYFIDLRNLGSITSLRIDPCNQKGIEFKIKNIRIYY